MEVYDDRPASFYDNLKAPTNASTPKTKTNNKTAITTTAGQPTVEYSSVASPSTGANAPATAKNGATRSPIYADISFNFNEKQRQQQHQQQQQQQSVHHQQQQQVQVDSNNQRQVHSLSSNNSHQLANNSIAQQQQLGHNNRQNHTQTPSTPSQPTPSPVKTLTMPITAATTTPTSTMTATAAARNASPAQRPLSQHSQSELFEASQSIAAVKAALNDAKSKFFGLNGYAAPDNNTNSAPPTNNPNESQSSTRNNATPRLLIDKPYPEIQIITTAPTPPPKPHPVYQNIPENSAVYRRDIPPELPPKPVDVIASPIRRTTTTPSPSTPPSAAALTLPMTSTPPPTTFATPMPTSRQLSASPASPVAAEAKYLPHHTLAAAYKQLPLNDIDTAQPSQAVYMSTTVPQNIKGSKIAGRHTPTRNSLRHSRMLVVNNKTYPGIQHPNPMNFKYPNLARWLLILEIIVGLLISFLAIWIFFLAPCSAIQDNPYWSGLVLLLAGILGLVLVRYQRIKRHKVRENCFVFLRGDSYVLTLLAMLLCCVALTCASLHFARLTASDTRCISTNILLEHGSCTCTFNANDIAPSRNSSAADLANGLLDEEVMPEQFEDRSYKVEYRDLSCKEVEGAWLTVLGLSIALNAIGLLLTLFYIVLLVCCRHNSKRFYTSVHTSTF